MATGMPSKGGISPKTRYPMMNRNKFGTVTNFFLQFQMWNLFLIEFLIKLLVSIKISIEFQMSKLLLIPINISINWFND